ncbi:hypothetical protein MYX65_03720 [Acidobacteria bacterium AH-259-L09]|nr:hypothetical protein [Acidobacteria bacterium AH-259-L09]
MRKLVAILLFVLLAMPILVAKEKKLWRADDPRLANSLNIYHGRNPLNPANKYRLDNDFNPINRFRLANPLNPARKYDFDNLLNPLRHYDIDSPLNPINKFRSADDPPRRERDDPLDLFFDDLDLDLLDLDVP